MEPLLTRRRLWSAVSLLHTPAPPCTPRGNHRERYAVLSCHSQSAAKYTICAQRLLAGRSPRWILRLFGGLAWARGLAALLVHGCAVDAVLAHASNPSRAAAEYCTLAVIDVAAFVAAVCMSPGSVVQRRPDASPDAAAAGAASGMAARGAVCDHCGILRPIRSVHCHLPVCNACIPRYDHHSPWTNACVGAANHGAHIVHLLLWVVSWAVSALLVMWGVFLDVSSEPGARIGTVFASVALPIAVAGAVIAGMDLQEQSSLASRNLTTNEARNGHRLIYFKSQDASGFYPAFDRGTWWRNWAELFRMGGVDWCACEKYTILDMEGHPLRETLLMRLQRMREAQAAGAQVSEGDAKALRATQHLKAAAQRAATAGEAVASTV